MSSLLLARPVNGSSTILPVTSEHTQIELSFSLDEALFEKVGENLEISFDENGTKIILENFYTSVSSENMPSFATLDGLITGEDFFAALDESLMPAAGSETPTTANDGLNFDNNASTQLTQGLDSLGQGENSALTLTQVNGFTSLPTRSAVLVEADLPDNSLPTIDPILSVASVSGAAGVQTFSNTSAAYVNGDLIWTEAVSEVFVSSINKVSLPAFSGAQNNIATMTAGDGNILTLSYTSEGSIRATSNSGELYFELQLQGQPASSWTLFEHKREAIGDLDISFAAKNADGQISHEHTVDVTPITTLSLDDVMTTKAKNTPFNKDDVNFVVQEGEERTLEANSTIKLGAKQDYLQIKTDGQDGNNAIHTIDGKMQINMGGDNDIIDLQGNIAMYATSATTTGSVKGKSENILKGEAGEDLFTISAESNALVARSDNKFDASNTINLGKDSDKLYIKAGVDFSNENAMQDGSAMVAAGTNAKNVINAGKGADFVSLEVTDVDSSYAMWANAGTNKINLGKGDDTLEITGRIGATDNGQNIIDGGNGIDTLKLQDVLGSDRYIFDGSTKNFTINNVKAEFKSFEKFEFSNADEIIDFTEFKGDIEINAGGGNDTISLGTNGVNTLVWTLDSLNVANSKDIVKGFDSNDVIDLTDLHLDLSNTNTYLFTELSEVNGITNATIKIMKDGLEHEIYLEDVSFTKEQSEAFDRLEFENLSFISI